MNHHEIQLHKKQIDVLLADNRIFEALDVLKRFIDYAAVYEFNNEFAEIKTSYGYLLQFFATGVADPQQQMMLRSIFSKIYTLRDKCIIHLSQNDSADFFFTRFQSVRQVNLAELVDLYHNLTNKLELLQSVDEGAQNQVAINNVLEQREKTVVDIFNKVWCSFPLSSGDASLLSDVFSSTHVEWQAKAVFISALFLGICKFFDEQKLSLLLHAYCNCNSQEVQIRAITAFVISLYLHQNRKHYSQQLLALLDNASQLTAFNSDIKSVFIRLVRSRNTENITKLMRDDLMPNLMKIKPDLLNKIKGKASSSEILDLEANPEWQEWLDNSGITKKMEELNELQFEGGDVFISAFSHLKSFPFFNTLANWFLPYNPNHSSVRAAHPTGSSNLLSAIIMSAPVLCDSDKFSLCFSLANMPDSQKNLMQSQFQAQAEQLKDLANDDDGNIDRDRLINQYVQDLYRFFKLFSRRRDFPAIFDTDLNLINIPLIANFIQDKDSISLVAEFYFKNNFYNDAISYYQYLLDNWNDNDMLIYQKIGFAFQVQGKYAKAIDYYLKFDLTNDSDLWNLQHIANCYKALKNNDKAFEYFKKAYDLKPDNIANCLNIGHHYLETAQIDMALKYYYKVDFLDNDKHRAWRPIAWCSFLKGDYEQSLNYYNKILNDSSPTAHDHLNLGHLVLCSKGLKEATQHYLNAILAFDNRLQLFADAFFADAHILNAKGIESETLPLICDYIFSQYESYNQPQ